MVTAPQQATTAVSGGAQRQHATGKGPALPARAAATTSTATTVPQANDGSGAAAAAAAAAAAEEAAKRLRPIATHVPKSGDADSLREFAKQLWGLLDRLADEDPSRYRQFLLDTASAAGADATRVEATLQQAARDWSAQEGPRGSAVMQNTAKINGAGAPASAHAAGSGKLGAPSAAAAAVGAAAAPTAPTRAAPTAPTAAAATTTATAPAAANAAAANAAAAQRRLKLRSTMSRVPGAGGRSQLQVEVRWDPAAAAAAAAAAAMATAAAASTAVTDSAAAPPCPLVPSSAAALGPTASSAATPSLSATDVRTWVDGSGRRLVARIFGADYAVDLPCEVMSSGGSSTVNRGAGWLRVLLPVVLGEVSSNAVAVDPADEQDGGEGGGDGD